MNKKNYVDFRIGNYVKVNALTRRIEKISSDSRYVKMYSSSEGIALNKILPIKLLRDLSIGELGGMYPNEQNEAKSKKLELANLTYLGFEEVKLNSPNHIGSVFKLNDILWARIGFPQIYESYDLLVLNNELINDDLNHEKLLKCIKNKHIIPISSIHELQNFMKDNPEYGTIDFSYFESQIEGMDL